MNNPIITQKKSLSGEFFINLFEWCNLNCDFCWQDHNDWTGIETIVERSVDIIDAIKKSHQKHFILNLMGGELFADKIPEETFSDYLKMLNEVIKNLPSNTSIEVNWVSNLVFTKTERVKTLLSETKKLKIQTSLTTSFDFSGRFKPSSKKIFERNLDTFKDYLGTISVVLTKPNIESLLSNNDELFKKLYSKGLYIYFDYYSPESNFEKMLPSDALLQKALLFLLENYPNVNPIQSWIKNDKNPLSCQSSTVIDKDGIKGKCRSLVEENLQTKLKSNSTNDDNSLMEDRFSNKYDCITCEFYSKCGMGCFLLHDFEGFESLNECLYKGVFRQMEKAK